MWPRRSAASASRLWRTVRHLRGAQVAGRILGLPLGRVLRLFAERVGRLGAPGRRVDWSPVSPVLRAHLLREARRSDERLERIRGIDRQLADYEVSYARALPVDPDALHVALSTDVAFDPYPSAVRARDIALAIRLGGGPELGAELARAARAVAGQLEWHLLGNHLLEDGIGLACAGLAATGPEARMWYRLGASIIERELPEQFLPDGGHFERSATYHVWVLTALLELIELHRAAGVEPSPSWMSTVESALLWLTRVRCPDGTLPLFNDAALDFCPRPAEVFELAEALGFGARVAGLSVDVLATTGWLLARAGDAFAVADVGPIGPEYLPGHAHADTLTFELWVKGRRLAVDGGVSCYAAGPERDWCRSTAAHNSLTIDNDDSAEIWGAFRVGRRGRGELLHSEATGDGVEWIAQHDGFAHLTGHPLHRRVFRLEPSALIIEDQVFGEGWHEVTNHLRFDKPAFEALGCRVEGAQGSVTMGDSVWYPQHGVPRPAVVWRETRHATLPLYRRLSIRWPGGGA